MLTIWPLLSETWCSGADQGGVQREPCRFDGQPESSESCCHGVLITHGGSARRWQATGAPSSGPRRRASAVLSSFRPLVRRLGGSLFLGPSSGEDASHAVIPFVTRILKYSLGSFRHGHRPAPRFHPHGWIVDREFVEDRVA